jgi:hypothetical protein
MGYSDIDIQKPDFASVFKGALQRAMLSSPREGTLLLQARVGDPSW